MAIRKICEAAKYGWGEGFKGNKRFPRYERMVYIFYCYLSSCSFSFRAIFCMSSMCDSSDKTLMLGKIEGRRRQGTTEDEMFG